MEVGLDLYFRVLCCTEHERNDLFSILGTLINLDVETEKKEYKKRKWVGGGGPQTLPRVCNRHEPFVGAFAKLRKATFSLLVPVWPSSWNNSAATGRIFKIFVFFFENLSTKYTVIKI